MASCDRGPKVADANAGATATGTDALACGPRGANANGDRTVAIGFDANAVGTAAQNNDNVAIGSMSSATDTHLLTVGALTNGDGADSTVIAWEADAIANL